VPLATLPQTANIEPIQTIDAPWLPIIYVPNIVPNIRWRHDPVGRWLGRSDYEGLYGLMDTLDQIYSSWAREFALCQARIIVPRRMLEYRDIDGKLRPIFSIDRAVYVGLEHMEAPQSSLSDNIEPVQFAIRASEHIESAIAITRQIFILAGYSPQTFGLETMGSAESGAALRIRERRSLMTMSQKSQLWRRALNQLLEMIAWIEDAVFGRDVPIATVEMQDSIQQDLRELAQSIEILSRAQVASKYTLVSMLHPDWTSEQVEQELQRLNGELTGDLWQ
jgi:hypothetical protein